MYKLLAVALLISFPFAEYVFAEETLKVVIKQIDTDEHRGVAEITGDISKITIGSKFIAEHEGQSCVLKVTSMTGNHVELQGSLCADYLRIGQNLEPSLFTEQKPVEKVEATPIPTPLPTPHPQVSDKKVKFSLGALYSLGSSMNANNFVLTEGASSGTGTANYQTGNAFGLSAEISELQEYNWGWIGGLSYEFPRNLNSVTVSGSGGTDTSSLSQYSPSMAFLIIYADGAYRWSNLYIPFGINFNVPFYQTGSTISGATSTVTTSGGLGGQVGIGYMLTDNLSAEFQLQYLTFTVSASGTISSVSISENFNTITFWDPIFKLKYTF